MISYIHIIISHLSSLAGVNVLFFSPSKGNVLFRHILFVPSLCVFNGAIGTNKHLEEGSFVDTNLVAELFHNFFKFHDFFNFVLLY